MFASQGHIFTLGSLHGTGIKKIHWVSFRFGMNPSSCNDLEIYQDNDQKVYEKHSFIIWGFRKCFMSGGRDIRTERGLK